MIAKQRRLFLIESPQQWGLFLAKEYKGRDPRRMPPHPAGMYGR